MISSPSCRIAAFVESRHLRPVRSIRPERRWRSAWSRPRKRAGADAADAVAVRGVSQGRRGARRTRRGIRTLGRRRCRTARAGGTAPGRGLDQRCQRRRRRQACRARGRHGARRAGRQICRPRRSRRCWRAISPISICSIRRCPRRRNSSAAPARRKPPALAVKGVTKSGGASASTGIGGMVLVTSTGFHGSYLRSSQGISMTAISGEGTGMERDYDYTAAPHAVRPRHRPKASAAPPASARWRAPIRARSKPARCRWCSIPRVSGSLVGHLVGAVNGASIARKTSFLKDRLGEQLFASNIRIIDDPLRRARLALADRSTPRASRSRSSRSSIRAC